MHIILLLHMFIFDSNTLLKPLPSQSKIPWKRAEPTCVRLFLPDLEIICDLKGEREGKKPVPD